MFQQLKTHIYPTLANIMVLAFINIIIYNKDKLINTNVKQMKKQVNNLSQLKKYLQENVEFLSKFPGQSIEKRTVIKKQTNGVFVSRESGGKSFLPFDSAKDFKFLSGNVVQLFCGNDLACTYYF